MIYLFVLSISTQYDDFRYSWVEHINIHLISWASLLWILSFLFYFFCRLINAMESSFNMILLILSIFHKPLRSFFSLYLTYCYYYRVKPKLYNANIPNPSSHIGKYLPLFQQIIYLSIYCSLDWFLGHYTDTEYIDRGSEYWGEGVGEEGKKINIRVGSSDRNRYWCFVPIGAWGRVAGV